MIPFESFSYPFFDLNYRAEHRTLVSSFLSLPDPTNDGLPSGTASTGLPARRGLKALYVHIPFCDTICAFCPFVKSVGSPERIAAYLDALRIEMATVGATARISGWELDAVYVGGGTPSVLSDVDLVALFTAIRDNFTIRPDAEISFEFEAKSVDEQKFQTLAELGVTRVSFGVQTFDPATRAMINITASREQVEDSITWATKYFTNTNLDMMVGFPGQTHDDAMADAVVAATSGIGSVSIYPVDYVMTLPAWQDRIRSGELPRPANLADRSRMFHDARSAISDHMAEQNMYCFGSADAPATRYMFSTLYGGYADECVGVGAGAYSFIRGLAYYNESAEREYVKQARTGAQPIAFSSPGHAYEKGLVFFPKRLTYDLRELDELGLGEVWSDRIGRIVNEGLADVDGDTLRLSETGKRSYSELMVHFFADAQRRIYDRMCERLRTDVGIIDDEEWAAGARRIRKMGAYTAMPSSSTRRPRSGEHADAVVDLSADNRAESQATTAVSTP